MIRYRLLLGVTLPTLEEEINRMVSGDPSAKLLDAFFAQGTGFVGVMECAGVQEVRAEVPKRAKAAEPHQKSKPRRFSS